MKLLGLRTIIYPTTDLARDKEWWAKVLGIAPYFDETFYVGFNVGGYELGLDPNADFDDGPRTYFGVEDVDEAVRVFVENNCSIYEKPSEVGGGIVVATVQRPSGQLIGLIYNPSFKAN
ncbi:VOC family protein [Candidatus Berkelbacteria bacterium]|nr:VOC family protein [Candidatus Berkelbacteria bacterium]